MLKVTLGELVNGNQSLMEMGEVTAYPPSTAFRISRAIRKTRDEMKDWNQQRRQIMKDSGKSSVHPSMPTEIWIDPKTLSVDEADALEEKMKALNDTEVEVEVNPIVLAEFGGDKPGPNVSLKPKWLADLAWLIVEK